MYDTSLFIYFLGVEEQCVGPVVEYEQTAVLHAFAGCRHAGYVVDGFVHRCVSVEVVAELHANAFKPVHEGVAGKTLCAVEAHVLEEVGKAPLVVVFEH